MSGEKIVIAPIDHYAGARHTRRTWFASLATTEGQELVRCGHTREGHKTVEAAITCGRRLRVPAGR